VRLVRFDPATGREIDRFGSVGFRIAPIVAAAEGRIACIHLEPGGRIGRHPAVGRQVLAVVAGAGVVSGADGAGHEVAAGVAAVWEDGEEHETRTEGGLTAIVVEGGALDVLAQP
jgi:quercetin dioxygenase-like cupin family protein